MPFTPATKNPGDLVKSQDWNDAMTAIVELFEKFNPTSGHQHTGTLEDSPPIQKDGIAENAVAESKIQDNAVAEAKMVDNAVSTAKIQDNAISTNKIQDGAVNLSKIAAGIIPPNIGIVVAKGLQNNQNIPIPTGFTKNECIFYAAIKWLNIDVTTNVPANIYSCNVDADGKITITPEGRVVAVGFAIAKKGGW